MTRAARLAEFIEKEIGKKAAIKDVGRGRFEVWLDNVCVFDMARDGAPSHIEIVKRLKS